MTAATDLPEDVLAFIRPRIIVGIDLWIADGRHEFAVSLAAIPDLPGLLIDALADNEEFQAVVAALAQGRRDAYLTTSLIDLVKTGLGLLVASGVLAAM